MHKNDSAVSPVIGVILMVAITVVLAATVWVWVSGFGGHSTPPGSLSLSTSQGLTTNATLAASRCGPSSTWCESWTVVSASSGFAGNRLSAAVSTTGTATCRLNGVALGSATLTAGDTIACGGTSTPPTPGDKITFTDLNANSALLSLTLA